jgi:RNA polymerase sigma-70 factor (ECF subfamily)
LLLTLERLSPKERAAFILYDAFGYSHDEVALMLDQSVASCRKLVSRAREHIKEERPSFESVDPSKAKALIGTFFNAVQSGDVEGLVSMFKEDIVLLSDGGGKVLAALNPIFGADRVARFLVGIASKAPAKAHIQFVLINGQPGALCFAGGEVIFAITGDIGAAGIEALYMVRNPDKLVRVSVPSS